MSDKQVVAAPAEVDEAVEKARDFWAKFSKPIIYVGSALILTIGGWLAYTSLVKAPNEEKAADLIFSAESIFDKMTQVGFSKDSINMVLNGGGSVTTGVLKVANSFGSTDAGNRAKFIAGTCYLYNKDFNNAVKYLKDFATDATQIQTSAYILLADAYAELKKNDDAMGYYKKAIDVNSKDEFLTPEALFKGALFAEATGKTKEAIDYFKRIKEEYPKNNHANDADKYLARLGVID